MASIETRLRYILEQYLAICKDDIKLDSKIVEDLGADSLDTSDIVMAIEEEFGLDISDEDVELLKTFGDIVKFVETHLP